jgi:zinc protease
VPDDLRAATLDEVREFFATYYHPGNASLAIAGAITPDEAFALAERYFGEIPTGPSVTRLAPEAPALTGDQRLFLEDRVELARVYLAWHSPAMFAPGDAELDLVSDLLASGKTSRLYRRLVYQTRLATEVAAFQQSRESSSYFQVVATAAPGITLSQVEAAITEEIERFAAEGPTDEELARVMAQAEAQFVYRLQSVGGFGGKSDQLNAYNVFLGEPESLQHDLDRYLRATPQALAAAARTYLRPDARVAVSVVPTGQGSLVLPGSVPARVH